MRTDVHAVIYGKPRQRECKAAAEGLGALGAAVAWRSIAAFDESGDVFPDADLVVTFGQRLWSAKVAKTYRGLGVPVLTIDLPPIRSGDLAETQRAVWIDHVNWTPRGELSGDRLAGLGLEFNPHRGQGSREVLVCGQTDGDAAHGMEAVAMRQWARRTVDSVSEFYRVTWRPHPQQPFSVEGFETSDTNEPIESVLQRDWRAVVTFNSTVGLLALVDGIPVFCDPTCFYAEVANTSLAGLIKPQFPEVGELASFFSRLAYVQWTFDEIASGEAFEFLLSELSERAA